MVVLKSAHRLPQHTVRSIWATYHLVSRNFSETWIPQNFKGLFGWSAVPYEAVQDCCNAEQKSDNKNNK